MTISLRHGDLTSTIWLSQEHQKYVPGRCSVHSQGEVSQCKCPTGFYILARVRDGSHFLVIIFFLVTSGYHGDMISRHFH